MQPGIERVQALADISRSALCCNSNETRAPISNPPNSTQLQGTPYHSPKLHPGLCSSVGMRRRTDTQTDTQTAVINIHFASATRHAKCNQLLAMSAYANNRTTEKHYVGKGQDQWRVVQGPLRLPCSKSSGKKILNEKLQNYYVQWTTELRYFNLRRGGCLLAPFSNSEYLPAPEKTRSIRDSDDSH